MTMNLKKVFTSTSFNLSSVFYARFCAGSFYQEFDECRTFLLYEKGIYGDNAPRCLELIKQFYGDAFRCTFDFANFVQCRQDTLAAYEMLKPYITYYIVK